jgi:hypothetical protein
MITGMTRRTRRIATLRECGKNGITLQIISKLIDVDLKDADGETVLLASFPQKQSTGVVEFG